jgi:hypothetical protein
MTAAVSASIAADATVAVLWNDLSGPQRRLILALIEAARPRDLRSSQVGRGGPIAGTSRPAGARVHPGPGRVATSEARDATA